MAEYFYPKISLNVLFCIFYLLSVLSFTIPSKLSRKDSMRYPFGRWPSTLSTLNVTSSSNVFQEGPKVDSVTGGVFWVVKNEDGRNEIYQYVPDKDGIVRWTSRDYDVRNRVNGRGGGSFLVYNDTVFFSNGKDNLLYSQRHSTGNPIPLTRDSTKAYADGCYSPKFNILFYVKEDIKTKGQSIAAINVTTNEETILPTDGEFFASPVISPDDTKLTWIQWNAPNMPWDETKLLVTSLEVGRNSGFIKYIQHGSSMMPKWNMNNELLYVHDASDWWNLYINNKRNFELNLTPFSTNVGHPMWRLGNMAFDVNPQIGNDDVVVAAGKLLYIVNSGNGKRRHLNLTVDSIFEPKYSIDGKKIYLLGGNATRSISLIELDLKTSTVKLLFSSPRHLGHDDISEPIFIQFPSAHNKSAYGYLYKPKNSNITLDQVNTYPPVIVNVHGGPTERIQSHLNLEIQYFTTRGFAFFDLDYIGSSGHGRKYRQRFNGKFGTTDTTEVIAAAKYLINKRMIDTEKVIVRGISFGGFTALLALSQSEIFKAGTFYGGISNMTKQIEDAHHFEKPFYRKLFLPLKDKGNFTDSLSPINRSINITAHTLFFHGLKDEFIHVNQTIVMHNKLLEEGKSSEMFLRKDGNEFSVKSKAWCLQMELRFYRKVFKL